MLARGMLLTSAVVGCCNSGHDIAASFYEQGAETVTMVQRSHTYVVSSEHGLPAWLNGYYEENGPPTEDADIMFTSLPVNVVEQYHIESTKGVYVRRCLSIVAESGRRRTRRRSTASRRPASRSTATRAACS